MKPDNKWIDEWRIGENSPIESAISIALLNVFMDFWSSRKLDEKSETTRNRYSSGLHALGGFLVEKAVLSEDDFDKTADELLHEYLAPDDGPLIYHDNEDWQAELDMVCRKLYRFMKEKMKDSNAPRL